MSGPLPAAGYISNSSRTVADAQNEWELDIAVAKETLGGFSEGSTLSISSNSITPVDNSCVYPVDASGGGTINTIQVTNIRDGQVIFLHCVSSGDPITIANLASGSGAPIATFSGQNIVLTNPAMFISLKYNATTNKFQEVFPYPTWGAPGAIGATTPNTGEFTSLTLTGSVSAHKWLGNSSSSSAAPSFSSITAADLPSTAVNSTGNLSPLFTTSISSQELLFTLSNASAGSLFGNFSGSSTAPSFNSAGSADQILGVAHTGGGLEYKTLTAGANITITPTAGTITIAASGGGGTNPMTTLGDTIYGASGGTETRLAGNTTTTKEFLTQTGTGSASAAPVWGTLASGDIPWATPGAIGSTTPSTGEFTSLTLTGSVAAHKWLGNSSSSSAAPSFSSITAADLPSTVVNGSGSLSPLFTTSISSQALAFSLSNASAGSLFGNFSGSSAAPSFNAPGSADQILGVAHTGGGLEYKTLTAGANITITPTAGTLTIAATGGGGTNPMTTLGDTIYGASGGTETRLAGNTSTAKEFLTQTGTGSASAAPVWGALASGDIPWAAPGAIGSTTPSTGAFSTISATGAITQNASTSEGAAPQNQGPIAAPQDVTGDGVVQGLNSYSSSSLTATLNASPNSTGGYAVMIIQGNRVAIGFGDSRLAITVSASKDTYIDVSSSGTFAATAVSNGAAAPSP